LKTARNFDHFNMPGTDLRLAGLTHSTVADTIGPKPVPLRGLCHASRWPSAFSFHFKGNARTRLADTLPSCYRCVYCPLDCGVRCQLAPARGLPPTHFLGSDCGGIGSHLRAWEIPHASGRRTSPDL